MRPPHTKRNPVDDHSPNAATGHKFRRLRIVVLGAGFGGLAVARGLKGERVQVEVIDRRNHHLFQPLLYQVATAALSPADVAAPIRSILRGEDNFRVTMDEVIRIDPERRLVATSRREVSYDVLVIASGSTDDYFGHASWAAHALGLKSLPQALEIRNRVLTAFEKAETEDDPVRRGRLMTIAIIGGGPTGVELAGAFAELVRRVIAPDFRGIDPRSARIVLLEGGDTLLAGFPKSLRDFAARALTRAGVEVRLSTMAEDIDETGVLFGGDRLEAQTVIWAAGQRARLPLADWLGLDCDRSGRVAVGSRLNLDVYPEIYVIGDAALCRDHHGRPLPGLAAVAAQQGRYVGRLLSRRAAGKRLPGPFRYRNWGTLATIGRSAAVADFHAVRLAGRLAWWLWGAVHITTLIGFRNRASVLLNWLWSYLTLRSGARVIVPPRENGGAQNGAKVSK